MQGKQAVIEIIPNWHPIVVHFTFALFTTSVGFYGLTYISSRLKIVSKPLNTEFEIVARWCLWMGAFATIITVLAGLYAFYTVQHDAVSHLAMKLHRNWALLTAAPILAAAGWSLLKYFHQKPINLTFIVILLVIEGALLSTAWHGSELVYRYGLGVMSLPKPEGTGHHHHEKKTQSSNETTAPSEEHHHNSNE